MISFNLRCQDGHVFEAWFKDGAAYDAQAAAGEVACPICGDRKVAKAPMAPRIAKTRGGDKQERIQAAMAQVHDKLAELRRHVEQNFDYVGDRFAEEAKRIHYGETEHRDIYGEATEAEAKDLQEEGVGFTRIPWLPRTNS
ncbi:MAG TPA: DUF1178 family protein [Alphaproteobacteria bacterium]|nr:DUF1178 family protein [Alphaproteobacteria bacterium]